MSRISSTLAVLAGLAFTIPGLFVLLHSSPAAMPVWLIHSLLAAGISGAALTFWGAMSIRNREMELYNLQHARIARRR